MPETSAPPHLLQQVLVAAERSHAHPPQQPLALVLHGAMLESGFTPGVQARALQIMRLQIWQRLFFFCSNPWLGNSLTFGTAPNFSQSPRAA